MQKYFIQLEYQEKKNALNTLNKMIKGTDMDTAVKAFALALEEGCKDIDSIWSTYYTLTTQPVIAKDLEINNPKVPNIIPFDINMKKYDKLMKGGEKVCNKP